MTALLVLLSACGSGKTKIFDGYFIQSENGVVLPIAKEPGSNSLKYDVNVEFGEHELFLKSPVMLGACYVSVLYEKADGKRDVMDVDLDFQDLIQGKYVYSIAYGWLPGKSYAKSIKGVTFFYAPIDAALPSIEEKDSDGTVLFTYPDFTGYKFMFQGDEVGKYLPALLENLR